MMSSLADSLMDKARVAIVAGDDLQTAILKATSPEPTAPKQKHVITILLCVQERSIQPAELFKYLKERLQTKNWMVRLWVADSKHC